MFFKYTYQDFPERIFSPFEHLQFVREEDDKIKISDSERVSFVVGARRSRMHLDFFEYLNGIDLLRAFHGLNTPLKSLLFVHF